jgi:hypothetical protein
MQRWVKRFEISVSILTALVTILSAVVAWRAALAGDAAGNADFAGISAALNREESRTLNSSTAYQQYRAYTTYLRNNEVGEKMANDLDDPNKIYSDEQRAIIADERTTSWDQILVDQDFFETRHLRFSKMMPRMRNAKILIQHRILHYRIACAPSQISW